MTDEEEDKILDDFSDYDRGLHSKIVSLGKKLDNREISVDEYEKLKSEIYYEEAKKVFGNLNVEEF
jgi:hypothetical protein